MTKKLKTNMQVYYVFSREWPYRLPLVLIQWYICEIEMSSWNTPIKITWFLAGVTTYVLRTTVAFLQMYGGAVIIITAPSKSPLIVYASRYLQNTVKIGINTEIKVNIGF